MLSLLFNSLLQTSPTENETKINANVTVIEMDEVPGGLDKIIGNLFKRKLKKRKKNLGILEIFHPKMEEPQSYQKNE